MMMNFLKLLQDSGNFMRNQPNFSLYGLALLVGLNVVIFYSTPQIEIDPQILSNPEKAKQFDALSIFLPSVLTSFVNVFITILLILNIKSINRGNYQRFFQNVPTVIKHFFTALILNFIMAFPLSMAMAFNISGSYGGLSILSLPLIVTGIYIFVKLSLVIYAYLIEEQISTIGQALSFTWQLSRGKMGTLFLFCIISYLFPTVLAFLVNSMLGNITTVILNAVLNFFIVIFSFRFYQVYRAIKR